MSTGTITTSSSSESLAWFLRSLGDHDTHRGHLGEDGAVLAACGATFRPRPTLRIAGRPSGVLVAGGTGTAGESLRSGSGVSGMPAGAGAPVSQQHFVHLLPAERELLAECHRHRVYLALCGAELSTAEMTSSFCEPGCDRMLSYCVECLDHAAACNRDAGVAWSPPVPVGSSAPGGVGR